MLLHWLSHRRPQNHADPRKCASRFACSFSCPPAHNAAFHCSHPYCGSRSWCHYSGVQRRRSSAVPQRIVSIGITIPWLEGEFLFSNDYVSRQQFFDTLAGRLRNLPGVKAVALSNTAPPVGFVHTRPARTLQAAGRSVNQSQQAGIVAWRSVSPDYFAALGIPILKGRSFNQQDRIGNQNPILYWSLPSVLLGSLMTALVARSLRTLVFQVPVENPALFALAACLMIAVAFRRSATSIHPGSKNGSRRDAARLPIERCSLET
jgi:hypothetical protein